MKLKLTENDLKLAIAQLYEDAKESGFDAQQLKFLVNEVLFLK